MTGLEKIIKKIESDCETECTAIFGAAEKEAEAILDRARADAEKAREDNVKRALSELESAKALALSKNETDVKNAALSAKNFVVGQVTETALQNLKNLPDDEYFAAVKSLIVKNKRQGDGVLRLSARDLNRVPRNFEAEIKHLAGDGCKIKLSKEPADIDGGFVLVYGDIEQNCSFDALAEAASDNIKDALYKELFGDDGV